MSTARGDEAEMTLRRQRCLNLIRGGAPRSLVRESLRAEFGITEVQANYVYAQVTKQLQTEFEEGLPNAKAQQLERLEVQLATLYSASRGDPHATPPRPANPLAFTHAIARIEDLVAKISGTLAPLRVKVDTEAAMTDGLVAIAASLSPEERAAMLERAREKRRLVELARSKGLV
jgi:hypothetical protein